MTIWIIEPHDPLIVRDGRPFSSTPGAQAISLSFPFPSTTTGGVRTRAGLKDDVFDTNQIDTVKKIKVRGPLLIQLLSEENNTEVKHPNWLVPAPADALLFEEEDQQENFKQLVPLELHQGSKTDFDENATLKLVGLPLPDPRKLSKEAPRYWYWHLFEKWLINPSNYHGNNIAFSELGHNGPQREHRTHVSIEADKRTAKEGALFGTSGLEFTISTKKRLSDAQRLALAVAVDDNEAPRLQKGIASLGGERRIVSWRKSNYELPSCPPELQNAIVENKACRVFLLTPAYFVGGYRPTWLIEQRYSVTPNLEAIAIQRPQTVSGWDLALKKPKPTRRLAPAGTVLFLTLEGDDEAIRDWSNSMWMQCISDDEQGSDVQFRNDGFGLAVLGTWSGKPEKM